jgi:hypothetical protein
MCLAVTLVISGVASQNGLSDGKLRPYSEIYCVRHIPTVIHPVIITVLSVIDSVSYKKEFTGAKNDKIN